MLFGWCFHLPCPGNQGDTSIGRPGQDKHNDNYKSNLCQFPFILHGLREVGFPAAGPQLLNISVTEKEYKYISKRVKRWGTTSVICSQQYAKWSRLHLSLLYLFFCPLILKNSGNSCSEMVPGILSELCLRVELSQKNSWDYSTGLPCPYAIIRRVSVWEGEEIGIPFPSLLSEVEQAKTQLDAKIKSYGFCFAKE